MNTPDISGRTQTEQISLETFASKVKKLLVDKNMSQSDLARAMWGSRKDRRGMLVAKNRDRISSYLKGRSFPEMRNLKKMADALGVTMEELAPDVVAPTIEKDDPEFAMTSSPAFQGRVYLRIRKIVSMETAAEIMAILSKNESTTQSSTQR